MRFNDSVYQHQHLQCKSRQQLDWAVMLVKPILLVLLIRIDASSCTGDIGAVAIVVSNHTTPHEIALSITVEQRRGTMDRSESELEL